MKCRWRVVKIFLSLAVITASIATGRWWVIWPDLTARAFANSISEGQFQRANAMLEPPARWVPWPDGETSIDNGHGLAFPLATEGWKKVFRKPLELRERTVSDFLVGRRTFGLDRHVSLTPLEFTAIRGRIVFRWQDGDDHAMSNDGVQRIAGGRR